MTLEYRDSSVDEVLVVVLMTFRSADENKSRSMDLVGALQFIH